MSEFVCVNSRKCAGREEMKATGGAFFVSFLVSGTRDRIFLNTSLGCDCRCQYCYLADVGITGVERFCHQQVFDELINLPCFEPGAGGSVLSIGCYSECFSPENRQETVSLIKKIAPLGNHIQLATKKRIEIGDLMELDRHAQYKNQIGIFISVPTLSQSSIIEIGTDNARERLEVLEYQHLFHNLYFVMYIKPVLPGITRNDISEYCQILQDYRVKCVVGGLLHPQPNKQSDTTLVGQSWFLETNEDQSYIMDSLHPYTAVYRHSVDIIKEYIEEEGNCND